MKKILLVAMAAAAMVSCSQNEEIENAAQNAQINFGTVVNNSTRAAEVDLPGLKTNGFNVYAYAMAEALGTGVLDNSLISNEKITWSTDKWGAANTHYWPTSGNVQFFAYSSKIVTGLEALTTANYPTIKNYAVPVAAASQEDLLVATATGTVATGTVNLTFNHALTQVNFSIKSKAADGLKYIVSSIALNNIGSVATYDYSTGWGTAGTLLAYDFPLSSTEADNTVSGTTAKVVGTESLMLIPQTLGTTASIVVKYKVVDAAGNEYYATPTEGKAISMDTEVFAKGKKMRYTLALTNDATPIGWDVSSVDGWNSETDTDK